MSPEELGSMLNRRPFVPLRIHVADQARYEVRNPEMAMIGRTVLFLGLRRDLNSPYFDEPVVISMRHITRIEPMVEELASQ